MDAGGGGRIEATGNTLPAVPGGTTEGGGRTWARFLWPRRPRPSCLARRGAAGRRFLCSPDAGIELRRRRPPLGNPLTACPAAVRRGRAGPPGLRRPQPGWSWAEPQGAAREGAGEAGRGPSLPPEQGRDGDGLTKPHPCQSAQLRVGAWRPRHSPR